MNSSNDNQNRGKKNYESLHIEDIINGMYDWVRVIDRDDNILYVNKAMSENITKYPVGKKCYMALGRETPCENCVSRKSIFECYSHQKEETINDRTFSIMSSPVKNEKDEIIAAVEVLHDITQLKQLQQQILEQNKKLQEDLNIAKKLQCRLLPKEQPEDKVKFSFLYQPCETLGGDFLDIFKIDESHTGVYIADVSGHGVSASMLTIFLRSSINKKELSPSKALEELFRDFNHNNFDADLYITVFYAIIDTYNKTITYSNAGHNVCPFVFNRDRLEFLRSPGIPISNWLETPNYIDKKLKLINGDRIFFYTDGIIEIKNNKSEQFGEDRLLDILVNEKSDPDSVLNKIVDDAFKFSGIRDASEIIDDITIALVEVK